MLFRSRSRSLSPGARSTPLEASRPVGGAPARARLTFTNGALTHSSIRFRYRRGSRRPFVDQVESTLVHLYGPFVMEFPRNSQDQASYFFATPSSASVHLSVGDTEAFMRAPVARDRSNKHETKRVPIVPPPAKREMISVFALLWAWVRTI